MTSSSYSKENTRQLDRENVLLDEIKAGFGFDSDAQLAAWLKIDRTAIYAVRGGKSRLSALQRLKVLDRIGFLKSRKLIESLLPKNLAADVTRWSQGAARRSVLKVIGVTDDATLLDKCKVAFECDTDADLADFLGLRRPAISMVRAGKSALGLEPKLRILAKIAPDLPCAKVEQALESTEYLTDLLKAKR